MCECEKDKNQDSDTGEAQTGYSLYSIGETQYKKLAVKKCFHSYHPLVKLMFLKRECVLYVCECEKDKNQDSDTGEVQTGYSYIVQCRQKKNQETNSKEVLPLLLSLGEANVP